MEDMVTCRPGLGRRGSQLELEEKSRNVTLNRAVFATLVRLRACTCVCILAPTGRGPWENVEFVYGLFYYCAYN
jgi:hypothetical protein